MHSYRLWGIEDRSTTLVTLDGPTNAPQRRIDDRIRLLCATLSGVSNGDVKPALKELLILVHQKSERLKLQAVRLLLNGERLEGERRAPHPKGDQTHTMA
jgi:hypothetical protein